jgi:hypothetical protein
MAERRIGIGSSPGQDWRAVDDEITGAREAHPEPGTHQQQEEHLTRRRSGCPAALGLLRFAGHSRLPIWPQG